MQRRELIELIEHDLRIGVALEFQHEPHRLFQVALVPQGRDALDPILVDQLGDPLLNAIAGLLERNLVHDDSESPFAVFFNPRAGAQGDRAAAGVVAAADSRAPHDHAAGGKVRAGHDLEQFIDRDVGFVDHADHRIADLAQIVRRDRRGHADCDPIRAVHEQIRKLRRQHGRLATLLVVIRHEIDRVELQVLEHQRRDRRHAGFGISHRGRRQPGDRAEIALLIDQRMPTIPLLRHPDQSRVDDDLAVRMIVAHRVAADLGAFDARRAGREIQIVHRDKNPPLRRLEPIAHVGQGPRHHHAHRVGQIAVLQLLFDRQLDDAPWAGRSSIGAVASRRIGPIRFRAARVRTIAGRGKRVFRIVRFVGIS